MNLINIQVSEFLNLPNMGIAIAGMGCIYVLFFSIFTAQGKEFFDGKLNAFESNFAKKVIWYLPWALIQQSMVLIPVSFIQDPWTQYGVSVGIFALLYHFPNIRLMIFTGGFAAVFYAAWYFAGFQSLIWISVLHAFAGTCYYFIGWDMRAWRFK